MSDETVCRWCSVRIKPCTCGADYGRLHWVDVDYGSRTCLHCDEQHTHEPTEVTE